MNSRYSAVRGQCAESCLELGLDTVPNQTLFNVLQRIDRKPLTYDNAFYMKNMELVSEI